MRLRLKFKLSFVFALIGIISLLSVSIMVNFFLEKAFREYAIQKQEKRNNELVTLISNQYAGQNKWKTEVIQDIGVNVLEEGMILKLTDNSNKIVWDAVQYNSGICQAMINQMTKRMMSKYPGLKGSYTKKDYPITSESVKVGILEIGYYGPFYYTDTEFIFIDTFNNLLIIVTIITLIIALIAGIASSNMLTSPLAGVIKISKKLTKGEYLVNEKINTSTQEIYELVETTKNLATTLATQEKLRKRLTADVSHELRTPLTTIQGHIEAMIDGVWKSSTDNLKSCHEEIIRMHSLVKDIELLAHYDSDNLILNKSKFNFKELVLNIIKSYKNQFNKKEIKINFIDDNAIIFADRDKISQVIVNLLSNILKFVPKKGEVEIRIISLDEAIKIIVSDTGPGISEEDLPYIFERFYRVDKSRSYSAGGSGIGLTIVKEIIKAHGGKIEVQSEPGKGTDFIILLFGKVSHL